MEIFLYNWRNFWKVPYIKMILVISGLGCRDENRFKWEVDPCNKYVKSFKKWHLLPSDTYTYVCLWDGKKL